MNRAGSYSEEDRKNLRIIVGLARTAGKENRNTAAHVSRYGITLAQFSVLEALYHLGDLRIGDIIEKTLSTGGNMTVVIKNLEKEGLVEKRCDPQDRRSSIIHLLPMGEDLMKQIFPEHIENVRDFFSNLNTEEKDQLSSLLKKLNGI